MAPAYQNKPVSAMKGAGSFLTLAAGTACSEMLQGLLRDCCPSWYQGPHPCQRQSLSNFHREFLTLCPNSHSHFHFSAQCLKPSNFCFLSSPSAPEQERIVKNINRNNISLWQEAKIHISLYVFISPVDTLLMPCLSRQKHVPLMKGWATECAGEHMGL